MKFPKLQNSFTVFSLTIWHTYTLFDFVIFYQNLQCFKTIFSVIEGCHLFVAWKINFLIMRNCN